MGRTAFWFLDVRDLMLLYVAAGLSFAPWGTLYALLAAWGWGSPVLAVVLLTFGALTALAVWNRLERLQRLRQKVQFIAEAVSVSGSVVLTPHRGTLAVSGGSVTTTTTTVLVGSVTIIRVRHHGAPSTRAKTLEPSAVAASPARGRALVSVPY